MTETEQKAAIAALVAVVTEEAKRIKRGDADDDYGWIIDGVNVGNLDDPPLHVKVRGWCGELLDAAQVDDACGCPLCRS